MNKRLSLLGLLPDTDYTVQVRANMGAESSEWSQAYDFRTVADTKAPDQVTNLVWESVGSAWVGTWSPIDTSGNVAWNNDFDRYEVRVTFGTTNAVYATKSTRFDFPIESNISVFGQPRSPLSFSVRTVDTSDNYSDWVTVGPIANPAPGAPTSLTATTGVESIKLDWAPPTDNDVDYYRIYMGFSENGNFNLLASPRSNHYVHNTTSTGMIYFRVYSVDIFGTQSTSYASVNQVIKSTPTSDTIPPKNPTAVFAIAGFDHANQQSFIEVTWTNPTENTDNSAATDLSQAIIRYSTNGSSWNYVNVPISGASQTYRLPVRAGSTVYIAVQIQDFMGNKSSFVNTNPYPATAVSDTTAPSTPAAPTATGNTLQVQVSHSNIKAAGGAMEADTAYYDVYASKTSGFTTYNPSTYLGKIVKSQVTSETFPLPATTSNGEADKWYVKVIAVDNTGNRSAASAQAEVVPGLIQSVNIADATITNAKIKNIKADKIEAGSALVTDITLKDGVDPVTGLPSTGAIKSDNFNETDRTGMKLDKKGLTVYDGLVAARALELRNSFNLVSPTMASFENNLNFYQNNTLRTNCTIELSVENVFGTQSLVIVPTGEWTFSFGTQPDMAVESGREYILSIYARGLLGTETMSGGVLFDNNAVANQASPVSLGTSFQRYSVVLKIPEGVSFALPRLQGTALPGQRIFIDGFQIEEKVGSLDSPSRWQPPSSTIIDGGLIKTGALQSSQTVNSRPAWTINLDGGAEFASAKIVGSLTVGDSSTEDISYAQSGNYGQLDSQNNPVGWKINSDGTADFNNITMRGKATLTEARVNGRLHIMSKAGMDKSVVDFDSGTDMTLYGKLASPSAPTLSGDKLATVPIASPSSDGYYVGPTFDTAGNFYMVESTKKISDAVLTHDFDVNINGFTVDVGGSVARTTTSPIAGTGSAQLTLSAGNRVVQLSNTGTLLRSANNTAQMEVDVKALQDIKVLPIIYTADETGLRITPSYGPQVVILSGQTANVSVSATSSGMYFTGSLLVTKNDDSAPTVNTPIAQMDNWTYNYMSVDPQVKIIKFNPTTGAQVESSTPYYLPFEYVTRPTNEWVVGFNWISGSDFDVAVNAINDGIDVHRFSGTPLARTGSVNLPYDPEAANCYRPFVYSTATNIYKAYCLSSDVESNLVTNPSLATASGWTAINGTISRTVDSTLQISPPATAVDPTTVSWASPVLSNNTVKKGEYIYLRAKMKYINPTVGNNVYASIVWSNGTATSSVKSAVTNGEYDMIISGPAQADGTFSVRLGFGGKGSSGSGGLGIVDEVRVSNNGPRSRKSPFDYKDGSSTGWVWTGVANNSASQKTIESGALVIDKVARSNPSVVLTRQLGHRIFGVVSGLYVGNGDYGSNTYFVTTEPDTTIPSMNYGLVDFVYVGSSPVNNTPVGLQYKEGFYLTNNGVSYNPATSSYYLYNRSTAKLEKKSKINSSTGGLSVAITYYSTGSGKESLPSSVAIIDQIWIQGQKLVLRNLPVPTIPEAVDSNFRPDAYRVYVGANKTTDLTKMQRITTTSGFVSSIEIDNLLTVPRGGDNTLLPGNTATTASNPPPTVNGFGDVPGFTAARLRSSNDVFLLDGNGAGRISGLAFSENGLILGTIGGTSGRLTTNTGGYVLNHDGTGSWPNMSEVLELKTQPHVRLGRVGAISTPATTNTWAAMPYDSTLDSQGDITISGGGVTINKTGLYAISAKVLLNNNVNALQVGIAIQITNNATFGNVIDYSYGIKPGTTNINTPASVSGYYRLQAGAVVSVLQQSSVASSAYNVSNPNFNVLSVTRVGLA